MKKSNKDQESINKKISLVLTGIIIFLLGIILGLLIRGKTIEKLKNKEEENNEKVVNIYDIEPIVKDYMTVKNRKVYLYNTNEIMLKNEGENITFKEYNNKYQDLDKVMDNLKDSLNVVNALEDGGTTIYETKDNNKVFDKKLTIIKCQTTDGNKDLYIGEYMNTLTAFENGACGKNYFNDKEFSRVYTIKNIKEVKVDSENDKYYLEITVDDGNKSTTINRVMNKESRDILKENKKYAFYFTNKYGELLKEDMEEIFNKATLTGVAPSE